MSNSNIEYALVFFTKRCFLDFPNYLLSFNNKKVSSNIIHEKISVPFAFALMFVFDYLSHVLPAMVTQTVMLVKEWTWQFYIVRSNWSLLLRF